MNFYSPLRYPGGKRKIADYVCRLIDLNGLYDCSYVEPFAGGASVALTLLYRQYAKAIYINDYDPAIYDFWYVVLNKTEDFCRLIVDEKVTIDRWNFHRRRVFEEGISQIERAFSLFFLNRTNRSGIIKAGVIGGKGQSGKWKLDVRFNKEDLIPRIEKIARHKNRIFLSNLDAEALLENVVSLLGQNTLVYLDPPYYVKGGELYTHNFKHDDHLRLARRVAKLKQKWIVSYDNVIEIDNMYNQFRRLYYGISYTAQAKYVGKELMVFSENLEVPYIADPTRSHKNEIEFNSPVIQAPTQRLNDFYQAS